MNDWTITRRTKVAKLTTTTSSCKAFTHKISKQDILKLLGIENQVLESVYFDPKTGEIILHCNDAPVTTTREVHEK